MFNNLINKFPFLIFFKNQEKNTMLILFKKYNCIFFHIPKTAGMSVSNALFGNVKWGHRTVDYYKSYYGDDVFYSLYKFCFVRNPYDRLLSAYTFLKKGGINNQDLAFSQKYLSEYLTFEDFVLRGLENKKIMEWVHFKPQYTFVCDNDKIVMDFIGKMENINEDLEYLCKQININNIELKKINMSSVKKNEFSDEIKSIIKTKYQKDFTLFYPDL